MSLDCVSKVGRLLVVLLFIFNSRRKFASKRRRRSLSAQCFFIECAGRQMTQQQLPLHPTPLNHNNSSFDPFSPLVDLPSPSHDDLPLILASIDGMI
jgi:hypothetical protein